MQISLSGKVRRSESEWREIFERWEQSGLSRGAFCEHEKISKASFDKWKRQLSGAAGPVARPFVELTVPSGSSLPSTSLASGELEVAFPGGVVLRWKA
jgi:hypothetical protein